MHRTGFAAVALTLVFAAVAPAPAQASEQGACAGQLAELSDAETVLEQLKAARAEGEALRKALRTEIFDLEVQLQTLKLEGADAGRIAAKKVAIDEASTELATSVKVAPVLARQIEVLSSQVDTASRDYLACVEAAIE